MTDKRNGQGRFEIYRFKDAPGLNESGIVLSRPDAKAEMAKIGAAMAGVTDAGNQAKVLYSSPGMSIVYLWFKSGFPLPRHSHDLDCLYYIAAGSLRIGSEELSTGDGFFVGADVPYAYTAGEEGVEVIEFRSEGKFHIDLLVASNFWAKTAETMKAKKDAWSREKVSPSGVMAE